MKNFIVGFLLGAGAVAAAFVLVVEQPASDSHSAPDTLTTAHGPAIAATARDEPDEDALPPTAAAKSEPTPALADQSQRNHGEVAVAAAHQMLPPEIPGGSLDASSPTHDRVKRLVEAFRIDCQYDAGHGGNWPQGTLRPHTISWQGGPITFDLVDLDAGTARLLGSSGFTRTLSGELEVRAYATDTGLHFSVFAPGGELIVASVYGALDTQRRNRAVVSFHGPGFHHESAQIYGACTLS